MLSFFPTPYPDELFYSVVARYHFWSRNKSLFQTNEDLYDFKTIVPQSAFPTGLGMLKSKISQHQSFELDSFIYKHSFFPLIELFINNGKSDMILDVMKGDDPKKSVEIQLGICRFQLINRHIMYCPICYADDVHRYGEGYLHRIHQFNGIKVCPIHEHALISSGFEYSYGKKKYAVFDVGSIKIPHTIRPVPISKWDLQISKMIAALFSRRWHVRLEDLKKFYIRKIEAMSLFNSGFIRRKKFNEQFIDFFGQDYLSTITSELGINLIADLEKLINDSTTKIPNVHPILHVLIMIFLEVDLKYLEEKVMLSDQEYALFIT
ncbi:hypothetical protein HGO21_08490 [Acinetobacter sp. CUI P1]|nr:hypothetical protein [Acinetobacter sp. CUI P1]